MRLRRLYLALLLPGLLLAACAGGGSPGWVSLEPAVEGSAPSVRVAGTVEHLEVEGGVWVIRAEDGSTYNPMNLPPDFRVEGLAVEADAVVRDDLASFKMVGPIVELVRVRRTEE